MQSRLAANPAAVVALAKSYSVETEASDKTIAVLGRQSAEERIAYLFLHLMRQVEIPKRHTRPPLSLPIAPTDAVGLTSVHVSCVIGLFRERGIVELSGGVLTVFQSPRAGAPSVTELTRRKRLVLRGVVACRCLVAGEDLRIGKATPEPTACGGGQANEALNRIQATARCPAIFELTISRLELT